MENPTYLVRMNKRGFHFNVTLRAVDAGHAERLAADVASPSARIVGVGSHTREIQMNTTDLGMELIDQLKRGTTLKLIAALNDLDTLIALRDELIEELEQRKGVPE